MEQGQGVRAARQGYRQGGVNIGLEPGVEDGGDPFGDQVPDLDRYPAHLAWVRTACARVVTPAAAFG